MNGSSVSQWSAGQKATSPDGDLTRWERYAQALLAANEFSYVD